MNNKNLILKFLRLSNIVPIAALLILFLVIILAISAPLIAPHDPTYIDIVMRLRPPFWAENGSTEFLLGTDSLGRDILSRIIYGARISLIVGFTVVAISGTLGIALGITAGYFGGRIEDIIMRILDIQLAFPFILLAISILAVLGPGVTNVIIVLGITMWPTYGRVVRGQVKTIKEKEYVEAAKAIGLKHIKIILKHILPNCWAPTIVIASFSVASAIVSEAALSFLGLGVRPEIPTWGNMLAEGREYIQISWWIVTFPGIAIMLTVLSINIIGDWLRDYLDPYLNY